MHQSMFGTFNSQKLRQSLLAYLYILCSKKKDFGMTVLPNPFSYFQTQSKIEFKLKTKTSGKTYLSIGGTKARTARNPAIYWIV